MDNRKMPASHAVTASVRAMRGNVLKCLVLKLSFLGWELLRGLIATAMAVLASIVFMLVAGGSIGALVDLTGQGSLEMSRDARFVTAMLLLIAAVLIIFGLALLAQLPLKLWLTSYENVAFAGFYQALAGETAAEELSVPAPAAVSGSAYFSNVQPAVPVTPFTPPVGEDVPGAVVPAETEETEAPPAAVGQELPPVAEPAKVSPYTPFGGSTEAAPEAPEAPVAPKEPAAPEEPEN